MTDQPNARLEKSPEAPAISGSTPPHGDPLRRVAIPTPENAAHAAEVRARALEVAEARGSEVLAPALDYLAEKAPDIARFAEAIGDRLLSAALDPSSATVLEVWACSECCRLVVDPWGTLADGDERPCNATYAHGVCGGELEPLALVLGASRPQDGPQDTPAPGGDA